jgi:hypothetical protein
MMVHFHLLGAVPLVMALVVRVQWWQCSFGFVLLLQFELSFLPIVFQSHLIVVFIYLWCFFYWKVIVIIILLPSMGRWLYDIHSADLGRRR